MKKQYWYERVTYQEQIRIANIIIWIILGAWALLDSWQNNPNVQMPLLILPVNMIALSLVYGQLQKTRGSSTRADRQLLILFALAIIFITALWVYKI
ncbi:MAG: hypothetical protein JWQ14_2996 [Adhaeribacter sp.]|nr:hypothetical protein [Adhaeribacter sp.]